MKRLIDLILLFPTKLGRSTFELERLNDIWERFNDGEDVLNMILGYKWIYHKDKVRLLIRCIEFENNI